MEFYLLVFWWPGSLAIACTVAQVEGLIETAKETVVREKVCGKALSPTKFKAQYTARVICDMRRATTCRNGFFRWNLIWVVIFYLAQYSSDEVLVLVCGRRTTQNCSGGSRSWFRPPNRVHKECENEGSHTNNCRSLNRFLIQFKPIV